MADAEQHTPAPGTPIGLEEMATVCAAVGTDMELMEKARAAAWGRVESATVLRQADVLQAVAKFLDRLAPHMQEIAPILRKSIPARRVRPILGGKAS
jgi:hypothetical protein